MRGAVGGSGDRRVIAPLLVAALLCGDTNNDGRVSATDAVFVLRKAVGQNVICFPELCDYDGDGKLATMDALAILQAGVGIPATPHCPLPATTTEPPTTPVPTAPPVVAITSPASGTTYTTAQTVRIVAAATDDVGVVKVEFYDGAMLMGTDTSAPYIYLWSITNADNGTHNWTAKAYDADGNSVVLAVSATK